MIIGQECKLNGEEGFWYVGRDGTAEQIACGMEDSSDLWVFPIEERDLELVDDDFRTQTPPGKYRVEARSGIPTNPSEYLKLTRLREAA